MENAGLPRTCATLSAFLTGSAGTTSRYVRSQDGCRSLPHGRSLSHAPDGDPVPGLIVELASPGPLCLGRIYPSVASDDPHGKRWGGAILLCRHHTAKIEN
ncbi:hypothetical protein O0L34_g13361 [Tuta absoluta]|nr:hypothetical protein O0L34_g13361 [Tuta absoluta]